MNLIEFWHSRRGYFEVVYWSSLWFIHNPSPQVNKKLYANSQEAEAAFYDAFSQCNLDAMMAVWADDEEIYCVHPGGSRIAGVENVRESWRQIFDSGQTLRFQLKSRHELHGMMIAVHSVYEQITIAGQGAASAPMLATNIYLRTDRGWRMVAHHASPAPEMPAAKEKETESRRASKTLH